MALPYVPIMMPGVKHRTILDRVNESVRRVHALGSRW